MKEIIRVKPYMRGACYSGKGTQQGEPISALVSQRKPIWYISISA